MPLVGRRVSQRTSAKCGQRMMSMISHQKNLSCSRHWPNVAKKMMPLVGGLCLTADFDQIWSKLCPSSEDFVTQRTSTKCGPNCALRQRTLSHSWLWPNVVRNVLLVIGLCLTADFDHMWSKYVPLVGGLCHTADFNQMWSKHVPLDGWLCFAMEFNHIWINNVLIIKKSPYQTNRS